MGMNSWICTTDRDKLTLISIFYVGLLVYGKQNEINLTK